MEIYSTGDIAKLLDVDHWRIRRLYEDGAVSEPARLAGKRAVVWEDVPAIRAPLRQRGWFPTAPPSQEVT